MSAGKRPSTSSLRRFITSRPYVTVAELRRRFGLEDVDSMIHVRHNGTAAWVGLPEREAAKLQDLWERDEIGMELSVEVRAPVVIGVYPMRIARYLVDGSNGHVNGHANGHAYGSLPPRPTVAIDSREPRAADGMPVHGAGHPSQSAPVQDPSRGE